MAGATRLEDGMRPTTKAQGRAQRYAAGMPMTAIAREDGITTISVRRSIQTLVQTVTRAVPGRPPLPDGYSWHDSVVREGTWYADGTLNRGVVIWALDRIGFTQPREPWSKTFARIQAMSEGKWRVTDLGDSALVELIE